MSWMALFLAMATGLLAFLAARYVVPFFRWPRWVRGAIFWPLPLWLYVASILVLVALDPTGAGDAVGWAVFVVIFAMWPIWFGWAFGYVLGHISRDGDMPSPR